MAKKTLSPAQQSKRRMYILVSTVLPALSVIFLVLEIITHFEFLLHVAAIPLEILVGAFLVERFMAKSERDAKRQQLMYIKGFTFRSDMRDVFVSNFGALARPKITFEMIKESSLDELKKMRSDITTVEYRSPEEMETVIDAYVSSQHAFRGFMQWAIDNDFEPIFHDMIYILNFIQDIKLFKERNPGVLFVEEAQRKPALKEKMDKVFKDGVCKFLDYAIELRQKHPVALEELLEGYQLSWEMRQPEATQAA